MLEQLRLAIRHPNGSGSDSEEEEMSRITPFYISPSLDSAHRFLKNRKRWTPPRP